jgi:hypothetical protein
MVTLSIEVVDVMSGEVVTHARAGYLTAIHQRASRALDQGLQKSIEDIAGTLSFSAATLARN